MKQDKGLALVVVLVMVLIFLSIIMAVVLSAATALRRASQVRDKFLALKIAEAGIQDCLYWMNYKGYWNHHYPSHYSYTLAYFRGSDYAGSDTWVTNQVSFRPAGFLEGSCTLYLEDNSGFDQDRIVSTGSYRGRTATVEVRLRGLNGRDNPSHAGGLFLCDWNGSESRVATWGIPEVFNKHSLYTYDLSCSSGTVNGNLAYKTTGDTTILRSLPGTKTITRDEGIYTIPPWDYFPVLANLPSFPSFPSPPSTFDLQFDKRTDQNGNRWDTYYRFGTVDMGSKLWYFDNTQSPPPGQVISQSISLVWGGNPPGHLHITDENNGRIFQNYLLASDGAVYFETSITCDTRQVAFVSQDGFSFTSGISVYCTNDGWLALNRTTSGSLTITGNPASNVSVKDGAFFTGSGITSQNLSNWSIDASSTPDKLALFVSTGSATFNTCTIKGMSAAGSGVSSLTFSNCTLDGSSTDEGIALVVTGGAATMTNCTVKGTIVVQSSGTLTLNNTVIEVMKEKSGAAIITRGKLAFQNNARVKGLVLVLSETGSLDCHLQSGSVEGGMAVKGQLRLAGGTVSYLGSLHRQVSSVFQTFKGGRRVYLPVVGSWRVY
ncbi:MAG: hypothetical protein NC911_02725 [Candidatus Omnitrophica bacterium]|nr:hypothetical protein [Candidatus Omnitrophota bacterium]